ncbi:type II secretion system protein GspL [Bradyrhizobium sp.]|uniref:type II secretion system protein GspL n=1 Tax=Bradyrhizobium sp. TaxID=376 RepID=UPI001D6E6AAE|nr:type II secretion system protein GspL [Bradyrhizobium sp.]MBI5321181.1 PilN domain-containing protein [Bradyrhizobium sp.]
MIEVGIARSSGEVSWSSLDEAQAQHPKLGSAVLLLPAQSVLRRKLNLPVAAAASLDETASFQIGRVTPFKLDQVHYLTRLLGRDRAKKTICAEVAVVQRAQFERTMAKLEAHGIGPTAILVEGDVLRPRLDFRPRYGPAAKSAGKPAWKPLLVGCLALGFALPLLAVYRIHTIAETSRADVVAAAKVARSAAAARDQLETLVSTETFLPNRLRGPQAIEMLDALTQQIPDTAWIFRLEVRANEATVSGFSTDVPALLQRLGTPPFAAPELTSPVVQGRTGGSSRFDLRVQYRVGS